jgi:heat shock protein HslJ
MISPRTILAVATVATVACVCAGCATQQADGPTSPSAPGRAPLLGTTWTATEIDGQPVDANEPQRHPSILLSAEGDRVSGSTGCNRISGTFTQQGSMLRFGALATTRVACVPDRGAAENAFVAAIEGTASHTIDNQTLELRDAAGTVRMRLRAS